MFVYSLFILYLLFIFLEYITALEQQVSDHKKHAEVLVEKLDKAENENKQLRQEVDSLKRQNLLLQQQQQLLQQQA